MRSLSRPKKWALFCLGGVAVAGIVGWRVSAQPPREALASFLALVKNVWTIPFFSVGSAEITLAAVVQCFILLIVLWLVTRFASGLMRTTILDRTQLDDGVKFSIQRVATYGLFALGTLMVLPIAGLDLTGLAVFGGALGIGIGLGFQTIVKNFAAGLVLLFEHPIKVGDRVQLGDLEGDIVNIGPRGTWVRTNDNVVMIVPNSEFVDGPVTNWTVNDRTIRLKLPVRVLMVKVAKAHEDVLHQREPDVRFLGFGDSSLDFELHIWTSAQLTTPRKIASDIYFALFAAFRREGIEIPFPQRDVHVRSDVSMLHREPPPPRDVDGVA